jgi:hypothetical protein
MGNFEHLNGPIKSVHDNPGAPGVANLCFIEPQTDGYYNLLATIYSTDSWPEQAYIERRMVACWNALVDLPQHALDGGWTRAGLEAYGVQMEQQSRIAKADKDEAITTLNNIIEYFRSGNSVAVQHATIRADSPEIVKAFEVLAKLKGGAA